jgi:hypothetical protein
VLDRERDSQVVNDKWVAAAALGRIGLGGRQHQAARIRHEHAPGADQAERPACLQHRATEREAAALQRRAGEPDRGLLRRAEREFGPLPVCAETQGGATARARVVDQQPEHGVVAGEHRFAATGAQGETVQVAKGVQHARGGAAGEREHQRVTEAEVVVDRGQQHHQQGDGESQSGAGRQHVDAAPAELDRRGLGGADAEQPAIHRAAQRGTEARCDVRHQPSATACIRRVSVCGGAGRPSAARCRRCAATFGNSACTSSGNT